MHNDGVFTAEDWKGIKSIYTSVKEKDALKVGRFGLGFKSIFHITGKFTCREREDARKKISSVLKSILSETAYVEVSYYN